MSRFALATEPWKEARKAGTARNRPNEKDDVSVSGHICPNRWETRPQLPTNQSERRTGSGTDTLGHEYAAGLLVCPGGEHADDGGEELAHVHVVRGESDARVPKLPPLWVVRALIC